jgi:hypothetical protein
MKMENNIILNVINTFSELSYSLETKFLELNPENTNAKEMLSKIEKEISK